MDSSQQKVVQYLGEARASEDALVGVLQSQIAMTPRGSYRSVLESHLQETREHAAAVASRLEELGEGSHLVQAVIGFWEAVIGQTFALSKAPLDLLRGSGGEEKVLKNAKDACATEALEIATYTAIERLARSVGDQKTATLAGSIRAQEEQMLDRVIREIPELTEAVVRAEVKDRPSYDVTTTGAADAGHEVGQAAETVSRKTTAATKPTARPAPKAPRVAQAEGQLDRAVASEGDLAIARYGALPAEELTARLSELSQIELAKLYVYERKNQNRATVIARITSLRGDEPWPGYDELTADEVQAVLAEADEDRANRTRSYERAHKNRASVLQVTEREHSNA
jgi:ferritin-like metal-binding protein YciE